VRPSQPIATTVFYQDFGAGEINVAEWEIYHSVGHAGWGLLRPSALAVVADDDATGGHALQITAQMGSGDTAGHLVSGGMKLRGRSQTYGRYRFRARVDPDQAEATSGAVLLWPADNDRPAGGEIDVFETWAHRATRSPVDSKLHWGEFGQDVVAGVSHRVGDDPVSGAEWHVYTLDWRKDHLSVSVDNGAPVTLSTNPDRIPQWPMELAIRLDGFDSPQRPGQQPIVSQPVTMLVDWIRIERFDS
jgi:beta-glucanase (GH16 family)